MHSISGPLQENFEKLTRSFDLSDKINHNLSELNASTEIISDNFESLAESVEALNPEFSKLNQNVEKAVEVPATIHEDLGRIGTSSRKLITDFTALADSAEELEPQVRPLPRLRRDQSVGARRPASPAGVGGRVVGSRLQLAQPQLLPLRGSLRGAPRSWPFAWLCDGAPLQC